jgi:hypothetical protein
MAWVSNHWWLIIVLHCLQTVATCDSEVTLKCPLWQVRTIKVRNVHLPPIYYDHTCQYSQELKNKLDWNEPLRLLSKQTQLSSHIPLSTVFNHALTGDNALRLQQLTALCMSDTSNPHLSYVNVHGHRHTCTYCNTTRMAYTICLHSTEQYIHLACIEVCIPCTCLYHAMHRWTWVNICLETW